MQSLAAPPKSLVRFIWKFVLIQRWKFLFIFLLSLTWSLDATLWPYLLRLVIDAFTQFDVNREAAWPAMKWLIVCGILLWIFVEAGFRIRYFLQASALPKLQADLRMAMFDHVQHHSPKYFNEHFAGSLSNKISDMVTEIDTVFQGLMIFLPTVATCTLSIIFFYQVSPLFALILGSWVVIQFAVCLAFTPKSILYSDDHGEERSALAGKIVDSLSNNFAVNLFYRFQFEKARIDQVQKVEQQKNYKVQYFIALMFLAFSAIFIFGGILLNGYMIHSWFNHKISTGQVIQIFNNTWNVIFIIWFACDLIPTFFKSIGVMTQAFSVMEDPKDILDPSHAEPLVVSQGEIVFENVSFHYGAKKLFENKNVHIKGGEKVGLVGYSGAGKSSFVNLILRFYPLEKGRILIDGKDISAVTLESLRTQVALIPQDPQLFHRTLEENIRFGRICASKEEVVEAARMAHCDEFISRIPNGYEALVGERGTKLSGGERQRIAIARAILASPPILILDEATSALDSITERFIQDSLEKLMQNRTTIVIAHRLSTLSKMDRILVLDEGRIVEEGSHLELLAKGGHYARLWQMQAGGFLPDQKV